MQNTVNKKNGQRDSRPVDGTRAERFGNRYNPADGFANHPLTGCRDRQKDLYDTGEGAKIPSNPGWMVPAGTKSDYLPKGCSHP